MSEKHKNLIKLNSKSNNISKESFQKKSNIIHNNIYDYSKVEYVNNKTKVTIICKEHGEFQQNPNNHLYGYGCTKCGYIKRKHNKSDILTFTEKANIVHNNKYIYKKSNYTTNKDKVTIICKDHGEFKQRPDDHLKGHGCKKCTSLLGNAEQRLYEYVKTLCKDAVQSDRSIIGPKELDIYIPSKKLGIEYDGALWHSEKMSRNKFNLKVKTDLAEAAGIRLIHIHEDLWLSEPNKIKALLKNAVGKNTIKYGARQTKIKQIKPKEYREFCERYHTQGYKPSKYKLGMFKDKELISVVGLSEVELIRYVVKENITINGALSKFMKHHNKEIFSYCDLDMFTGKGYEAAGFKLIGKTGPQYWYIFNSDPKRISRLTFQKHKLPSIFKDVDMSKTEKQICNENKYYRLYGVGSKKYAWEN